LDSRVEELEISVEKMLDFANKSLESFWSGSKTAKQLNRTDIKQLKHFYTFTIYCFFPVISCQHCIFLHA